MVPLFIETPIRTQLPEPSLSSATADNTKTRSNDSFESHLRDSESPEDAATETSPEEQAAVPNADPAEAEEPVVGVAPSVDVAPLAGDATEAAETLAAQAALAIVAIPTEETPQPPAIETAESEPSGDLKSVGRVQKPRGLTPAPVDQPARAETPDVLTEHATETASVESAVAAPLKKTTEQSDLPATEVQADQKRETRIRVADETAPTNPSAAPESTPKTPRSGEQVAAATAVPQENKEQSVRESHTEAIAVAESRPTRPAAQSVPAVPVVPATEGVQRDPQKNIPDAPSNSQAAEADKPPETSHARFGPHLLQASAERTESGPHLSEADESRLIERVARAVRFAENRDGLVRLRLSPPELGSLRLELRIQAGVMTARLEAETNGARTLLMENLPVLRDRLAEQGIRIEQFEVDLRQRQGQAGDFSGAWEQSNGREPSQRSNPETERRRTAPEATPRPADSRPSAGGPPRGLDVVV